MKYTLIYVVYFDDIIDMVFSRRKYAEDYVNRCFSRHHYTIETHKLYLESI